VSSNDHTSMVTKIKATTFLKLKITGIGRAVNFEKSFKAVLI
jgi:hypothetical protein